MSTHSETDVFLSDNPSSWRHMVAFFEDIAENITERPYGGTWLPVLRLVRLLASSPCAQAFRAGQSLFDLVISTKDRHGLDEKDPHIRVSAWRSRPLHVEYWRGNQVGDLVERSVCEEEQLYDTLKPLLDRLWDETKGAAHDGQ